MLSPETEHSFNVKGLTLKAKSWGNPQDRPVLAIHGWLDNCHSFKEIAKKLDGIYLLAIDLAGSGQSDHRSLDASYNIWQDVADVFAIADALDFKQFSLMGHSRGAFVSLLCAGTFPKRVEALALIDGFVTPGLLPLSQTPAQLAQAIKTNRRFSNHKRRLHKDIYEAVKERSTGNNKLSEDAAMVLAQRGIKTVEGGVIWSSDPRCQAASEVRLCKEQCQAFIDQASAKALVILATAEISKLFTKMYQEMVGDNPLYSLASMEGTHHPHLERETIDEVARNLSDFFNPPVE